MSIQRSARTALRRYHELAQHGGRRAPAGQQPSAADEARRSELYLAVLQTIHTDCGAPPDWSHVRRTPAPTAPSVPDRRETHEALARAALDAYRPGIFARLIGEAEQVRARLAIAIADAMALDNRAYAETVARYQHALAQWNADLALADGVLRLEIDACRRALAGLGAFHELATFACRVQLEAIDTEAATLTCYLDDPEIVSRQERTLSSSGKLSGRDMQPAACWSVFRNYVGACVLRTAREVFAALPTSHARMSVYLSRGKAGADKPAWQPILEVRVSRETVAHPSIATAQPWPVLELSGPIVSFDPATGFAALAAAAGPTPTPTPTPTPGICDQPARVDAVSDPLDGGDDPEQDFIAWSAAYFAKRDSAGFKIKTLVNKLGCYRAEYRLSLKAVHHLADVLGKAGFETAPDLRAATQSPGIEARVRVSRRLRPAQRSAVVYQQAATWVSLASFLWGAGSTRLGLTAEVSRPRGDAPAVHSVAELVRWMKRDRDDRLGVLESLIATGALEHWLLSAQRDVVLATLATSIRRDDEPRKAERWFREASRR